jgi:hypothetical protein
MLGPFTQAQLRQVVGFGREVARALEARHEAHAAVQFEAARVVAAANVLGAAGPIDQALGAVRAHIAQAAQRALGIACEQHGFVQQARQQVVRRQAARFGHRAQRAQPMPGAGEDAFTGCRPDGVVQVEGLVQGLGQGHVGVDVEAGVRHGQLLAPASA